VKLEERLFFLEGGVFSSLAGGVKVFRSERKKKGGSLRRPVEGGKGRGRGGGKGDAAPFGEKRERIGRVREKRGPSGGRRVGSVASDEKGKGERVFLPEKKKSWGREDLLSLRKRKRKT